MDQIAIKCNEIVRLHQDASTAAKHNSPAINPTIMKLIFRFYCYCEESIYFVTVHMHTLTYSLIRMTVFLPFPPSCDTHLPHPVPGDLWEGDEAQTSVLQHGSQRGKAERALVRPIQQTSCCGELRAARVCVLAGWRLGSGESSRHTHTHTYTGAR